MRGSLPDNRYRLVGPLFRASETISAALSAPYARPGRITIGRFSSMNIWLVYRGMNWNRYLSGNIDYAITEWKNAFRIGGNVVHHVAFVLGVSVYHCTAMIAELSSRTNGCRYKWMILLLGKRILYTAGSVYANLRPRLYANMVPREV